MTTFIVGKTDGSLIKPNESEIGRACKTRRFKTYEQAVAFIDGRKEALNGTWFLDAPESWVLGQPRIRS
jgi:hypothetical protein